MIFLILMSNIIKYNVHCEKVRADNGDEKINKLFSNKNFLDNLKL